jgi:hypothetical protein
MYTNSRLKARDVFGHLWREKSAARLGAAELGQASWALEASSVIKLIIFASFAIFCSEESDAVNRRSQRTQRDDGAALPLKRAVKGKRLG